MDLVIAISQGLGLAAAAGLLASAPIAVGASAATQGWLEHPLHVASDAALVAIAWALVAVELLADAVWPGAQAGLRLGRRIVAGGLVFELGSGGAVPYVGLVVGALVAAGVGLAMRRVRSGAVKAGGDVRGTALVEDGAGLATAAVAVIPFVGYLLAAAAGWLLVRLRRRDDQKFRGLRVLR
jgi:hypothetical protein